MPSYRFQSTAILALQEASESFLVDMFEQVNYMDIHGRDRDIKLWKRVILNIFFLFQDHRSIRWNLSSVHREQPRFFDF